VARHGRVVTNNPDCQDPATAEYRIWVLSLINVLLWVIWKLLAHAELGNGKAKLFLSFGGALTCFLMVSVV
jgi:hypothetical protein